MVMDYRQTEKLVSRMKGRAIKEVWVRRKFPAKVIRRVPIEPEGSIANAHEVASLKLFGSASGLSDNVTEAGVAAFGTPIEFNLDVIIAAPKWATADLFDMGQMDEVNIYSLENKLLPGDRVYPIDQDTGNLREVFVIKERMTIGKTMDVLYRWAALSALDG